MKCEYCNQEIPSGSEVGSNGHYFCNQLHRYYWEQRSIGNIKYDLNSQGSSPYNESSKSPELNSSLGFNPDNGMTLGDIFSNSINLIKETFTRNIIILVLFLVPSGILLAFGLKYFFTIMTSSASITQDIEGQQIDPSQLLGKMIGMVIFVLIILIFALAYLGAEIGVLNNGCKQIEGKKISINDTISKIFSITYIKVAAELILLVLALMGIIIAGILSMYLLKLFVLLNVFNDVTVNILGVILIIAAFLYAFNLLFKWYFAEVILVHTGCGIIESFKRSSYLVKNNWWRTFGIVILISLVVGFAVSLILSPLSFVFMWDYYRHLFKIMASGGENQINPVESLEMFSKLGTTFGLIIVINLILRSLAFPLFQIVMYFDLKIRKNDFDDAVGKLEANSNL